MTTGDENGNLGFKKEKTKGISGSTIGTNYGQIRSNPAQVSIKTILKN